MNTSLTRDTTLSQSLSLLTYNGDQICIPTGKKLNLYMGIGLWSHLDHLSMGLPIDVIQMLLSAAILRLKIVDANPLKSSKIIILIADSMAVKEGAEQIQVNAITSIYQQCLEPLLTLLSIKEWTSIILSSQLEKEPFYQETLQVISQTKAVQEYAGDREHYHYICTQSAITQTMSLYQDVGIKVGWIHKNSVKHLNNHNLDQLKNWDELKFDTICKISGCAVQYLYAKAGLKLISKPENIEIREGCPYTAYSGHYRYVIISEGNDFKEIDKPLSRVAKHWMPIIQACLLLKSIDVLNAKTLPEKVHMTNNTVAVQQCLSYWVNLLVDSEETKENKKK